MTRREELFPEIRRLREDEGLKWREIGERLGISLKTACEYYHDPDNSRHMERHRRWQAKDAVAGRCASCEAPIQGASLRRHRTDDAGPLCWSCHQVALARARAARDEDIALMWEAGLSQAEIARELGYGLNSSPPELSRLMQEGRIQARREGFRRRHELERSAA